MTAASILIPGKFVVLIGQLLITIVILYTKVIKFSWKNIFISKILFIKSDNIYAGLPANTSSSSDSYISAQSRLFQEFK